ncbi:MAG: hypothetical protein HYZ87_01710, partial [Candidatus Omnitrophica bacterium]|nr:hypothetical protein [Candidatus Omnitrophota bacterium]
MQVYTCPTCGSSMERDLLVFIRHTDSHIIDELKKKHPEWITQGGFCVQCLDYFKKAMGKSEGSAPEGAPGEANIGPQGVRRRVILGGSAFLIAVLSYAWLYFSHADRALRLVLWVPFFGSAFGFMQAREKLCVVLAAKGTRDMDLGEHKVS